MEVASSLSRAGCQPALVVLGHLTWRNGRVFEAGKVLTACTEWRFMRLVDCAELFCMTVNLALQSGDW